MSEETFRIRRATLEDLPTLRGLWQTALFSVPELERSLTSFYLVEGEDGRISGALGFESKGEDAVIRHVAWTHPDAGRRAAPALVEPLHRLARNRCLHRIWIENPGRLWEADAPELHDGVPPDAVVPSWSGSRKEWKVWYLVHPDQENRIRAEFSRFREDRDEERMRVRRFARQVIGGLWLVLSLICVLLFYWILDWLGLF